MTITRDTLLAVIDRVAAAMERDFDMLNSADGALGDGDLGVTMARGMRAIRDMKDDLPDDIGMALFQCAQAFTKTSGSSYGTLMATGLMSAAKSLRGQDHIDPDSLAGLVADARDKMQERGKADLGGKTVLAILDYLSQRLANSEDKAAGAVQAVDQALEDFREKPATVGRARIFGERALAWTTQGCWRCSQSSKRPSSLDTLIVWQTWKPRLIDLTV